MKLSGFLLRQHLGWMFKRHWLIQGKRVPMNTGAEEVLKARSIPVFDPEDLLNAKKELLVVDRSRDIRETPVKRDETHPNWHDRVCHIYGDNDVLLEGLKQALILTKSVQISENLPKVFEKSKVEVDDDFVQKIILSSLLFDAQQVKLPKLKDPKRPAWIFPRAFGITHQRRMDLLTTRLIQYFETNLSTNSPSYTYETNNAECVYSFEKDGELVQMETQVDTLLTGKNALRNHFNADITNELTIDDLHPLLFNVSIPKTNIYKKMQFYPIQHAINVPHTIFVHYDPTKVGNIYEKDVTHSQIQGRALLKAFTTSAAYAKQLYGNDIQDLPTPITVQCINTDSKFFYFGLFQLNTLNVNGTEGPKNIWCQLPRMDLFGVCDYKVGRPVLTEYNADVVKIMANFLSS